MTYVSQQHIKVGRAPQRLEEDQIVALMASNLYHCARFDIGKSNADFKADRRTAAIDEATKLLAAARASSGAASMVKTPRILVTDAAHLSEVACDAAYESDVVIGMVDGKPIVLDDRIGNTTLTSITKQPSQTQDLSEPGVLWNEAALRAMTERDKEVIASVEKRLAIELAEELTYDPETLDFELGEAWESLLDDVKKLVARRNATARMYAGLYQALGLKGEGEIPFEDLLTRVINLVRLKSHGDVAKLRERIAKLESDIEDMTGSNRTIFVRCKCGHVRDQGNMCWHCKDCNSETYEYEMP